MSSEKPPDDGPRRPYPIPLWAAVEGAGFRGRVVDRPGPFFLRVRLTSGEEQLMGTSLVTKWQAPSSELVAIMREMIERGLARRRTPRKGDP